MIVFDCGAVAQEIPAVNIAANPVPSFVRIGIGPKLVRV